MRAALGKKKLLEVVQLSECTVNRLEKNGEFPKRFPLTDKRVAWNSDEVEEWLDERQRNGVSNQQFPDVRQRKTRPVKSKQGA